MTTMKSKEKTGEGDLINAGQTRIQSLTESVINIMIGYLVAVMSQLLIFPWFDIHVTLSDNLLIGAYFTAISLFRSYLVRRWFNMLQK